MMHRFVGDVERRLTSEPFNAQQLSNLLWALAISQVTPVQFQIVFRVYGNRPSAYTFAVLSPQSFVDG